MERSNRSAAAHIIRPALAAALLMFILLYMPTPYAAYEPGIVEAVAPMVKVERGDAPSQGVFMLTTVKMTYANYWTVLRSLWNEELALLRKKDVLGDQSEAEYAARLLYVMQSSQSNAVEAAYREAGIPYESLARRLAVTDTLPEQGGFRPGDALIALDGVKLGTAQELVRALQARQAGDRLNWTVVREGQELQLTLPLAAVPQELSGADLPLALGGIVLAEIRDLVPSQPELAVSITAGEIGGPSAGLMFALQTLDALTAGDLTAGLRIAGTGTITPDGQVGGIGGARFKVTAAHLAGAELFLVPPGNLQEAREKAQALGSGMRIEPVATLHEAVMLLQSLAARKAPGEQLAEAERGLYR